MSMDYQTLQTVIEDLTAIKSIEGAHRLIEKYEAMAETIEEDMAVSLAKTLIGRTKKLRICLN